MSNRKRLKTNKRIKRKRFVPPSAPERTLVELKPSEKEVIKRVPAKADGEEIGEAIIYEDGTIDIVRFADISPQAERHLELFKRIMEGKDDGNVEDGTDTPTYRGRAN